MMGSRYTRFLWQEAMVSLGAFGCQQGRCRLPVALRETCAPGNPEIGEIRTSLTPSGASGR